MLQSALKLVSIHALSIRHVVPDPPPVQRWRSPLAHKTWPAAKPPTGACRCACVLLHAQMRLMNVPCCLPAWRLTAVFLALSHVCLCAAQLVKQTVQCCVVTLALALISTCPPAAPACRHAAEGRGPPEAGRCRCPRCRLRSPCCRPSSKGCDAADRAACQQWHRPCCCGASSRAFGRACAACSESCCCFLCASACGRRQQMVCMRGTAAPVPCWCSLRCA